MLRDIVDRRVIEPPLSALRFSRLAFLVSQGSLRAFSNRFLRSLIATYVQYESFDTHIENDDRRVALLAVRILRYRC